MKVLSGWSPSLQSLHENRLLTNALRRIRNAWHFYHALTLVIKVVCGDSVLRCSPLK
ncbi:TPA: DUF3265 domain-containing protein, partial [Vibrio vulnificus]|nr:DUF3265 domain-containing protein [Vibrio vulnificus]